MIVSLKVEKAFQWEKQRRLPGEKKTERIVTFLSHSKKIKAGHWIRVLHAQTQIKISTLFKIVVL